MKKNFDRIGKGVSQISGIARWGFLGMTAAIAGVTYAAQKQEKAVAKLVQQMKNHGEATQENISALTGLASELQRVTQFGDEQIIAGQAMLASFNLTTQQIKELTPHMLNLAVMTENTTGQQADLAAVAKMVGVALGGQAGRLVQMGIAMTDAQKETLRLADADEKINILMQIFEENAGGLAEAVGTTLAGSLSKAKNAMGDLAEELGFLLSPVIIKACEAIVEKVREWKEAIQALTPEQKKLITQIVFLGTAALGAIGALGLFSTVARVVQGAGLIIAGTFGLITSPLGLIMVAVGALALAWAYNWGDIQGKTKAAWDFLKPIFQGIWEALSGIEKEMEKTTGTIEKETKKQASGWETALKVIKTIGLSLKEIFLGARDIIIEVLDALGLKWEGFRWIFATGLELLATDWGEFIEDWKAGIDIIKKWLDVKFKWTLEKIGEGWKWFTDTLIPWLWTWAETTFYWLLDLTDPVWDKFKGIMQWVKEHAILYFNWAIIKIGDTWDWLEKTLWPWVKKWGVKAFEWSLDLFKKVRNWLENTLIPWTEDFKDKTFKWTLDLFGNVWDKIKDLVEWLGKIPEILKPVREGMQEVGEAAEKIVSPKVIKDMSHLESEIRGQRIALEWASKGWATYDSVAKKWIASIAATFILFEHEITDIAAKAPLEFSQEFQKGFMRATPDIQKAILDAILSGDFERALSLAGVKAGKAFMGRSPGMLTELEEGTKETKKLLDRMLGDMDAMTKKIMKIFQPIIGLFETMFKGITDRMIASENETISQMGKDIKAFVDDILALMKGLFEGIEKRTNTWYEWQGRGIKKQLSLWQKFCKAVSKIWESISETIRSAFIDTTVDIITGVTSIQKGFVDLANTIYRFLVRALIDATIQAMATSQSMIQALKSIAAEVMTT
ncbi:MAG: hypothetical protein HWN68_05995, partial [Desulfobacterales bacterium]|nr:hypothetical protein [Desulfobacterales bacterium]